MSYNYNKGNGVSVLLTTEPAGSEQVAVSDEAIRQIDSYLLDDSVGPEAIYKLLEKEIKEFLTTIGGSSTVENLPTGFVAHFGTNNAISGWILCDGRELSRTTYADLFSAIGVTFGSGDGISTFNVPDARERVIIGEDPTFQVVTDGAILAKTLGSHTHKLVVSELAEHDHETNDGSFYKTFKSGEFNGEFGWNSTTTGNIPSTLDSDTVEVGGDGEHNNVMPTIVCNLYIKT